MILALCLALWGLSVRAETSAAAKAPAIPTVPLSLPGLVQGSIFNRDFIAREKNAPPTVVFDLDGTLARMTPKGDAYVMREHVIRQMDDLKNDGKRLALWTAQAHNGLQVLAQSRPDLLPRFDVIITGENFIPQSVDGFDDPEFAHAYRHAEPGKVNAFYLMGVAKDLSLFDGSKKGRGYMLIVDDNHELEAAAPQAPYGPFSVYRIKPFLEGPDHEPEGRLAKAVRQFSKYRTPPPLTRP